MQIFAKSPAFSKKKRSPSERIANFRENQAFKDFAQKNRKFSRKLRPSSKIKIKRFHKVSERSLSSSKTKNKNVHDLGPFSTGQRIMLLSSRGQGIFEDLQASRPSTRRSRRRSRPRTSNCVLEDVLEAKDVLEDSTSAMKHNTSVTCTTNMSPKK